MQSNDPQMASHQFDEAHLYDYLNVVIRRWKIVLAVFLAVFLGVTFYTYSQAPVYEAFTTLRINGSEQSSVLGEMTLGNKRSLGAEIELLKSRTLAEKVAERLQLNWEIRDQSTSVDFKPVVLTSASENSTYRIVLSENRGFEVRDESGQTIGTGSSGELFKQDHLSLLFEDLAGKPGDGFTLSRSSLHTAGRRIQGGIRAHEAGKGTGVIKMTYRDTDPVRARDVVNTMTRVYREQNIALKTREASKTVTFIENQLENLQKSLNRSEKALHEYQVESGLTALGPETDMLVENLVNLERQRTNNELQMKRLEFSMASYDESRHSGDIYFPSFSKQPQLASLFEQLNEMDLQQRLLLEEFTESHPAVQEIKKQIETHVDRIRDVFSSIIRDLRWQNRQIDSRLADYEQQLNQLPKAKLELAQLSRVSEVATDTYTFMLRKKQEARIARAAAVGDINIIDAAIAPTQPVKPNKKKNLLLGLVLGLMLGTGLAFFQDYLDDTIKDADSAKRLFGYPVLATIPFIARRDETERGKRALISQLEPKSPPAEAFRALRTAVHFAGGHKEKTLLITSTIAGEGKTSISANLAQTMAQTGNRVLLIGCDLRRPTLHTLFTAPSTPGLTELLIGDADTDEVIHGTETEGLDFINAGTTPPNPAELLSSARMREVLDSLGKRYDTIMLDAPPLLAVTDAAVLTPYADLALIVVEAGKISAKASRRMSEELHRTGVPVAGLVFNDKTGKGQSYYGGYYGGYGYGYGDDSATAENKGFFARIFGNKG